MQRKLDCLWVDWYTAQVVATLRECTLEPILLKGPAITRWLYAGGTDPRGYLDADLLVAPDALPAAERALAELGFEVEEFPWLDAERPHAKSWRRGDGAVIDLHRVPRGFERLDPTAVWATWRAGADLLNVGGVDVLVPAVPARLLALLLSVRPDLEDQAQELTDLDRALGTVDFATWLAAAQLARRLGLQREAGFALSRRTAGAELASRLQLPVAPPFRLLLEADPLLRAAEHISASGACAKTELRRAALAAATSLRPRAPPGLRRLARRPRCGVSGLDVHRAAPSASGSGGLVAGDPRTTMRAPRRIDQLSPTFPLSTGETSPAMLAGAPSMKLLWVSVQPLQ